MTFYSRFKTTDSELSSGKVLGKDDRSIRWKEVQGDIGKRFSLKFLGQLYTFLAVPVSGLLDSIVLILVWFERYLLPAQFTERHNWYKGHAFALAVTGCSGANGLIAVLKEQYLVTAHAPNFDFWTGCREIKRCEESKRTLKNPFASRLAKFNTTIKLLRITDQ